MTLTHREEGGEGPLLLLLHGAARNLEDWGLVVPLLTDRYRVVTADLRGHGGSAAGPWTWEAAVDDVAALLDHLGGARPVVAGHSLGGMVATLCAARLPLARAVNVDGLGAGLLHGMPADERAAHEAELAELSVDQLPGCAAPLAVDEFASLLAAVEQSCRAAGLDPAPVLSGLRRGSRRDGPVVHAVPDAGTVRALLGEVSRLDLGVALDAVTVPLTVVRCTRRTALPPQAPDWLASAQLTHEARLDGLLGEQRPAVEVVEVDASHGLLLEDPGLVASLL